MIHGIPHPPIRVIRVRRFSTGFCELCVPFGEFFFEMLMLKGDYPLESMQLVEFTNLLQTSTIHGSVDIYCIYIYIAVPWILWV